MEVIQAGVRPEDLDVQNRTLPVIKTKGWTVEHTIETLTTMRDRNVDVEVDLRDLRFDDNLNMELPNIGPVHLSKTARKQLGALFGVKWEKWFDKEWASHDEANRELKHRISMTSDKRNWTRIFRARKWPDTADKVNDGQSVMHNTSMYVRGVVSNSYVKLDDLVCLEELVKLRPSMNEEFTVLQGWISEDYTSLKFALPIEEKTDNDPNGKGMMIGFAFRNSEVGLRAMTWDEYLFRLLCLNGMILCYSNNRLFKQNHSGNVLGRIDNALNEALSRMEEGWDRTIKGLPMTHKELDVPAQKEITYAVRARGGSAKLIDKVTKAWENEPLSTPFGVFQAFGRAAHNERGAVADELQKMGGDYFIETVKEAA